LTYWELSDVVVAKLSAMPPVACELASSTAVSRAVLKGEEGSSESTSVSLIVVEVAGWKEKEEMREANKS
jgi:hypothetical protein